MECIRNGLLASGSIANSVDSHQVGPNTGEDVFRQINLPEHSINLYSRMKRLPGGHVLNRKCDRKRRFSFQNYYPIGTGKIPGHEVVVNAVNQAVGRFEGSRRSRENILFKQEPVLERDDVVAVFGQWVRRVANLFDLVIHSSGLFCVELEPCMRLDTVECRLIEELDSTSTIVPGNVVHDLERRTARKVEVDIAEHSFANGW